MHCRCVCVCVSLDEHFNAHIWIFQVMSGLLLISLHSLSQQLKLNMYIVGRKKKCNEWLLKALTGDILRQFRALFRVFSLEGGFWSGNLVRQYPEGEGAPTGYTWFKFKLSWVMNEKAMHWQPLTEIRKVFVKLLK